MRRRLPHGSWDRGGAGASGCRILPGNQRPLRLLYPSRERPRPVYHLYRLSESEGASNLETSRSRSSHLILVRACRWLPAKGFAGQSAGAPKAAQLAQGGRTPKRSFSCEFVAGQRQRDDYPPQASDWKVTENDFDNEPHHQSRCLAPARPAARIAATWTGARSSGASSGTAESCHPQRQGAAAACRPDIEAVSRPLGAERRRLPGGRARHEGGGNHRHWMDQLRGREPGHCGGKGSP